MDDRRRLFSLFRGNEPEGESYRQVRPPYGESESAFRSKCAQCETKACATSCDEQIIVIEAGGTPILNFTRSGCTFCEECAKACEERGSGSLSLENTHTAQRINARFVISTEGCMAHHGVICFSCKEPCIDNAILFNGLFNPVIDTDRCTGCGFCLSRCPVKAIAYQPTAIVAEDM